MATVATAANTWNEAREQEPRDVRGLLGEPVRDTILPPAPTGELTVVRARTDDVVDDDALRWLDQALAEEIEVDEESLDDFDERMTPNAS